MVGRGELSEGIYLFDVHKAHCSFALLCGDRKDIIDKIMDCDFEFSGRRWKRISNQAKVFVEDLLVSDPEDRLTANEAICSLWLNKRSMATVRGPTEAEFDFSTNNIQNYTNYSKLKKLALMVIAHKSTSEEIGILRKIFQKYDTRGDGSIKYPDFKKAVSRYGFTEKELHDMFDGVVSAKLDGHIFGADH